MLACAGLCQLAFGSWNAAWAQAQTKTISNTPAESIAATRENTRAELERELLLPLLQEERVLAERCGPDHEDLRAVREKISATRDYLATIPTTLPELPKVEASPTRPTRVNQPDWTSAKSTAFGSTIDRASSNSRPAGPNEIQPTGYSIPNRVQPHDPIPFSVPLSGKILESPVPAKPNENIPAKPPQQVEMGTKVASLSPEVKASAQPKALSWEQESPAPFLNAPSTAPVLARSAHEGEHASADGYFLKISSRQLAGVIAALLACFLVQLIGFWLLLSRYAVLLARSAWQELPKPELAVAPASQSSGAEEFPANLHRLHVDKPSFDVTNVAPLGPTWAEELQRQEDDRNRQGEALLQQLFQQNLELRKQVIVSAEAP